MYFKYRTLAVGELNFDSHPVGAHDGGHSNDSEVCINLRYKFFSNRGTHITQGAITRWFTVGTEISFSNCLGISHKHKFGSNIVIAIFRLHGGGLPRAAETLKVAQAKVPDTALVFSVIPV